MIGRLKRSFWSDGVGKRGLALFVVQDKRNLTFGTPEVK